MLLRSLRNIGILVCVHLQVYILKVCTVLTIHVVFWVMTHFCASEGQYHVSARMYRCKDAALSLHAITNCTHACYAEDMWFKS
jgi:hypothetical protein